MSRSDPAGTDAHPADRLTPRQVRLVAELLQGDTLTKAAERAGIGLATAKRWLRQEPVREALKAGQRQTLGELARLLAARDVLAVTTLAELAQDATTPPATRRSAANALLQRRLQAAVVAELEDRLARLEEADGGDGGDGGDGCGWTG